MDHRRDSDPTENGLALPVVESRQGWVRPVVTRLEAGKAENFASSNTDGVSTQS